MSRVPSMILAALALSTLSILVLIGPVRAQEPTATVTGVVRATTGEPLAGTAVRLIESRRATATDGAGRFRFLEVPAGTYTLEVVSLGRVIERSAVTVAAGQTATVDLALDARPIDAPTIRVVLDRLRAVGSDARAAELAGSAHYIGPEELAALPNLFDDVHDVLRTVPGVYVTEEDGYGLRPNVGLRGTGSERSGKITLMEDGVLIAPAPYAAPAAYYFPLVGRMEAIEVRKGSSQIKYGPQTIGGAVNLISSPIPESFSWEAELEGGSEETGKGRVKIGDSYENFGWLAETYQARTDGFKRLDGGGDTGYELDDYLAKLRYNTDRGEGPYQEFELKLGHTEQNSDETYMGLTDDDFAHSPYRRYAASRLDNLDTEHEQYELRHYIELGPTLDLTSVIYRNDFARNWYKVEQVGGQSLSNVLEDPDAFAAQYAWLTGTTSPDDAITIRNNNREYESQGVQTILAWAPANDAALSHSFELGLRYHEDEEDRFQDNDRYRMQDGLLVLTTDGTPGSQTNRIGSADAFSAYLQDEIRFGDWIVTPGVRYEHIELEQRSFATSDPDRSDGPTSVARSSVSEVIPGIGAVYQLTGDWSLLASMHKGFNPPAPGSDGDAEESINYEAGVRYYDQALTFELIGFYNDYDNLVGTCTTSTGGDCEIGDQFDAGEVKVQGVEMAASHEWVLASALTVPLQLSYTYTDAEFRNSFESGFEEWGTVSAGDSLPYLPPHQLQLATGLAASRWSLNLSATYVDAMRVVAGQGPIPPEQSTDERWVVDLAGSFDLTDHVSLFARLENVFDETYIAARRPAGVRSGRPQTVLAGVTARF